MSFDLIAYGMLMAGLGFAVGRFAPGLQSWAWLAGGLGAGAGLLFALWNADGRRSRALASASLLAVTLVAAKVGVDAWKLRAAEESGGRIAFAIAGLMVFLSASQALVTALGNKNGLGERLKGNR